MTARRKGRKRVDGDSNNVVRLPVRFKSSHVPPAPLIRDTALRLRTDAEKYQAAVERQQQKHQPRSPRREEIRRLLREKFGGKNAD